MFGQRFPNPIEKILPPPSSRSQHAHNLPAGVQREGRVRSRSYLHLVQHPFPLRRLHACSSHQILHVEFPHESGNTWSSVSSRGSERAVLAGVRSRSRMFFATARASVRNPPIFQQSNHRGMAMRLRCAWRSARALPRAQFLQHQHQRPRAPQY